MDTPLARSYQEGHHALGLRQCLGAVALTQVVADQSPMRIEADGIPGILEDAELMAFLGLPP